MSGAPKEYGVFLPVANGGWIVSNTTPVLDGGWTQNRDAAIAAEAAGFDFAMAMGKWRGFGGETGHWGNSLEALTTGIAKDCEDARAYFASAHAANHTETRRQTTRDRI